MGANTEPDIEWFAEFDLERAPGGMKCFILAGNRHKNMIGLFLDPDSKWSFNVGLNFACLTAAHLSILDRCETVAVNYRVSVGGIRFETLANEQAGLAVWISTGAYPADVCGKRDVA